MIKINPYRFSNLLLRDFFKLAFNSHKEHELENSEGTENRFQNLTALYNISCVITQNIKYIQ